MKYDHRSFNELASIFELLQLTSEIQKSGEPKSEVLEKISLLQREIKFEKLKRARREYKGSEKPMSEWPSALQGEFCEEWEIQTREKLGLEVSEGLRIQAKNHRDIIEQRISKPTV